MANLYDRIGGEAAVDAAVNLFYEKVLADDRIKHFFVNTNMERQKKHQKRFLTFAFGGCTSYYGRSMRVAHEKLVQEQGLNDDHFDAVMENLGGTLVDLGVPSELITEAATIAESTRHDVLGRDPESQ